MPFELNFWSGPMREPASNAAGDPEQRFNVFVFGLMLVTFALALRMIADATEEMHGSDRVRT
jgi:hypothetical protein